MGKSKTQTTFAFAEQTTYPHKIKSGTRTSKLTIPYLTKKKEGICKLAKNTHIMASFLSSAESTGTTGGSHAEDSSSRWICANSFTIPVLSL